MRKLLLIVDMQEGFRSKESEAIVGRVNSMIGSFKGEIAFAEFVNKKGSRFEKQIHWSRFQDKKDREIFPELNSNGKIKVKHSGYTVLDKELRSFIKKHTIKEVYLCGVLTDVCIIKTAMDLFDFGIETFVIEDECASLHGRKNHKYAIDSLRHIIGRGHVLKSKDILRDSVH